MSYYNSISKGYDELYYKEQSEKLKALISNCPFFVPRGLILDIGAGTGLVEKELCQIYNQAYMNAEFSIINLEPERKMLNQCSGIKVIGSAEKLPFPDKTFDIIISLTSLHHAAPERAITEILRTAKPNAVILLSILKHSEKLYDFKKILSRNKFRAVDLVKDIGFIRIKKTLYS
ncbi:class I SAM-dependent methyltransferase [archaeon]|nr:class I SAM-dependent methyltransferase [archaeon]